jgi:hypothetical protein
MPLGWERINVKKSTPNKNIVFIKPLSGPTEKIGQDYLERIAAQCLPIMNRHHLAVASLEEYEYNTEFLGRNFNNGEVIQLVLRSASGHWLPFNFVQMVMMHELAHNKQMNHSKAFWAVRNEFAAEMKVLWEKGYTGDGLWGRGVLLENGLFTHELEQGEAIPEHMCGGTFRSRGGKKRKAKPKITYKEAKERRIRKKFGTNGTMLGADDEIKVKLEKGKKPAGKPRVAGSARGRELRASAALARFEAKKEEPQIKDEELVTDSEAESEMEDEVKIKTEPDDAIDINGRRLLDSQGRGMVRVCEDENDDDDAKNEMMDLHAVPGRSQRYLSSMVSNKAAPAPSSTFSKPPTTVHNKNLQVKAKGELITTQSSKTSQGSTPHTSAIGKAMETESLEHDNDSSTSERNDSSRLVVEKTSVIEAHCPVCSVINDLTALTCIVCANVLKQEFVVDSWRCKSSTCRDGAYINAGDVNLCGVCNTRREVLQ